MEDTMLELLEDCRQKQLYCMHNDVDDLIESSFNSKLLSINLKSQRLDKEKHEVKNIVEQAPKRRTRLTNTIPKTESDKVIKSSGKNLVPIPSESEVTSDNKSECDVPVNDESSLIFTTFSNPLFYCNNDFTSSDKKSLSNEDILMIYSNSLFDNEEIISTKIDLHYLNAESNLLESLLNQDTLIDSSPKFDSFLEEFSGELAHIDPIPPRIEEANFDLEEEIRLVKMGVLTAKVMEDVSEHYVLMPKVLPSQPALCLNIDTLLPYSSKNEDKVFKPIILSYLLVSHRDKITFDFFDNPMMMYGGDIPLLDVSITPDLKASRACSFVYRPLEFQSLAYGNLIS
nr:hypothetical protein [Tanacetum cinerariifolium]